MNRTVLATLTGLILGLALVFGNFGDMLIVAVFGLAGYGDAQLDELFSMLRGLRLAAGDFTDQ